MNVNDRLDQIDELIRAGRVEEAELCNRELLQVSPHDARGWTQWASLAFARGRLAEAEQALRRAVALDDQSSTAWNNLSVVLREQGRAREAQECALKALALDGTVGVHWHTLGGAYWAQRLWPEAADAYRQAVDRDPHNASAWNDLGVAEQMVGRLAEAGQAYERSLALAPNDARALTNYAFLCVDRGEAKRALKLTERALEREPQLASTWVARGKGWAALGDDSGAETAYRTALRLQPQSPEARRELVLLLLTGRRLLSEAKRIVADWLREDPDSAEALALWCDILHRGGRQEEAMAALTQSLAIEPRPDRHAALLLYRQYDDGITPDDLLRDHRIWNLRYAEKLAGAPPPRRAPAAGAPLRIGFVSEDFAAHPVGFLSLAAFALLDRTKCTVVCYSDRQTEDAFTARFRGAADRWRATFGLTSEELTEQIRRDEIDVLVDLAGHVGKRLLVFARKPAAVQVTWLGYVGTTGLAAMDFLLADRFHVREGEEQYYAEKILRMPHGYACYGPPEDAPEVGPLPALGGSGVGSRESDGTPTRFAGAPVPTTFTFGCFNNPAKYAPPMLDAWAEILRRVPSSRLLLKYGGLDDPGVQQPLLAKFDERGIGPGRVVLEGWSPQRELLAAYNRVDLALDTQPYSGGVTTCEALWMGVPVVTFPGQTFAGRHAVSHLTNAGYEQFIAGDATGYVDLAVEWANRLDELAAIRSQMREQVRRSPLCDARQFARDFLAVIRAAWESRVAA